MYGKLHALVAADSSAVANIVVTITMQRHWCCPSHSPGKNLTHRAASTFRLFIISARAPPLLRGTLDESTRSNCRLPGRLAQLVKHGHDVTDDRELLPAIIIYETASRTVGADSDSHAKLSPGDVGVATARPPRSRSAANWSLHGVAKFWGLRSFVNRVHVYRSQNVKIYTVLLTL